MSLSASDVLSKDPGNRNDAALGVLAFVGAGRGVSQLVARIVVNRNVLMELAARGKRGGLYQMW
jgi:hypothetical protein